MAGTKTTAPLRHFVEFNPRYQWLDTLGIDHVVVGAWGSGKTARKQIKGFKVQE